MSTPRKNILLLFVDQMRFDTIHALGNETIKTPNLDRLVSEGVAFTNAYSPSPVCVPARCSMSYGKYPWNTDCFDNHYKWIDESDDEKTFVERLAASGYRTHGVGKCHFTPDTHAHYGFQTRNTQEEFGTPETDDYMHFLNKDYAHVMDFHGMRSELYMSPQLAQMPAEKHPTAWIADQSIDFLNTQTQTDEPWYLFSSFIHPHPPLSLPTPWHRLYRYADMDNAHVPDNWEDFITHANTYMTHGHLCDEGRIDRNMVRTLKAFYYGAISFVDYHIGRILDTLEANNQLDNTTIVFTSDHGEMLGDYKCVAKSCMMDPSARIPFLVRFPDTTHAGTHCDTPVSLVDLAPTFLSEANIPCPDKEFDGCKLQELIQETNEERVVFSQINKGEDSILMAVDTNYKYFFSAPDDKEILTNRQTDPRETQNLSQDKEYAKTLSYYRSLLCTQMAGTQAGRETFNGDCLIQHPIKGVPFSSDDGHIMQDPPIPEKLLENPYFTDLRNS